MLHICSILLHTCLCVCKLVNLPKKQLVTQISVLGLIVGIYNYKLQVGFKRAKVRM